MNIENEFSELLTSEYSVESFQVPVPAGDCSIHLLLEESPESKNDYWKKYHDPQYPLTTPAGRSYARGIQRKNGRGKIFRAVLVDGGHDGHGYAGDMAASAIRNVIKAIQDDFGIETLQFDAWVVTHWDRDHFCGTLQMLVDDLQEEFDLSRDKQKTDIDEEMREKKNRKVPKYFKYAGGKPTTTLYCPSFQFSQEKQDRKEANARKKTGKAPLTGDGAGQVKVDPPHWRLQRSSDDSEVGTDGNKTAYVDVMLAYRDIPDSSRKGQAITPKQPPEGEESDEEDKQEDKQGENGKKSSNSIGRLKAKVKQKAAEKQAVHEEELKDTTPTVATPAPRYIFWQLNAASTKNPVKYKYWQKQVCKLVVGWEQLRGMDFFSGVSKIPRTSGVLNETITAESLLDLVKVRPAFLCVGAEGYLLNKPPTQQEQRRGDHKQKVVKELEERENREIRTAPSGDTWDNYISIMSLIVWPKSNRNQKGRISYFCGGDANAISEIELAEWLKGYSVSVIKASHHGANTATPPKLLSGLDPDKVILPAGYMYGHPTWTVMTLLFAYWEAKVARTNFRPVEKFAMSFCFPYYLEGLNYKKPKEPKMLAKVDLNPENEPNYTDDFAKFKSKVTAANLNVEQLMTQSYTPGRFRELTVAEALEVCNKVAENVDKLTETFDFTVNTGNSDMAEMVKELEKVPFLKNQNWLSTFISELQYFHVNAVKIAAEKQKKSKSRKALSPEYLNQLRKAFRDMRIRQYLYIMMLSEYWGSISGMDANWGRKDLKEPVSRKVQYLWTRSCDNSILDGRVLAFESWEKLVPSRETPKLALNGHATIQTGQAIAYPDKPPQSLKPETLHTQKIQAESLQVKAVNFKNVLDAPDKREYEHRTMEKDEESTEVAIAKTGSAEGDEDSEEDDEIPEGLNEIAEDSDEQGGEISDKVKKSLHIGPDEN